MKKMILLLFPLVVSCSSQFEEGKVVDDGIDKDVVTLDNFNNTGVTIRLENTGLTRASGIIDEYEMESKMPDGVVLKGIIRVETSTLGEQTVSLYRLDDYVVDEMFIGSYTVDTRMYVRRVMVGSNSNLLDELGNFTIVGTLPPNFDRSKLPQPQARQPEEGYWSCVRREYQEMKKAYENRLLDDIVCDIVAPACKALALVAAAYECGK